MGFINLHTWFWLCKRLNKLWFDEFQWEQKMHYLNWFVCSLINPCRERNKKIIMALCYLLLCSRKLIYQQLDPSCKKCNYMNSFTILNMLIYTGRYKQVYSLNTPLAWVLLIHPVSRNRSEPCAHPLPHPSHHKCLSHKRQPNLDPNLQWSINCIICSQEGNWVNLIKHQCQLENTCADPGVTKDIFPSPIYPPINVDSHLNKLLPNIT